MYDYKNKSKKSKSQFPPAHPDETTEAESVLPCNTISSEAWTVVSVGCQLGSQLEAKGEQPEEGAPSGTPGH